MYQTGDTIHDTLYQIQRNDLVLPAIQREFVWSQTQICTLFDSIMQGYPFNTFLYWRVNAENSDKFKFYDFVRDYHERDNPHCPTLPPMPNQQLIAVLDGQQRLTALNIGLRGTFASKLPRKWWSSPDAFPVRRLHLDLLWQPDDDQEEGIRYRFAFRNNSSHQSQNTQDCWFPVIDVMSMKDGGDILQWVDERLPKEKMLDAYRTLDRLHSVIHKEKLIAYYQENNQDLERVLQVFIRTNSGGTILSYSDLLLSIAVAQWTEHDARYEIYSLVDEINRIHVGFTFSKDFVLKAGLMIGDIGSVGFKVENFNRANMEIFEDKWDDIKRALTLAVELIADFGFNGQNLRAQNSILPIAYYLYIKNPGESYLTHSSYEADRTSIRQWLMKSLLKSGIWGSGLDTLLTALRQIIKDAGTESFPVKQLEDEMARRGKSLSFEEEEIEQLADMQYGDRLAFALLSILFPFVDLRHQFHVDHIFPDSGFSRRQLKSKGVDEDEIDHFRSLRNGLANLQLLEGPINVEKRAKMPADWLTATWIDNQNKQDYIDRHSLGDVPESITEFEKFYVARRDMLKSKIGDLIGR